MYIGHAPEAPKGGSPPPPPACLFLLAKLFLSPVAAKSQSEADSKCDHFLIGCWMDFENILVPIWLQLGSQNPPKMEPSWVQNRPNLEHSFRS